MSKLALGKGKPSQSCPASTGTGPRPSRRRDRTLAVWIGLALACGFLAYIARLREVTQDAFHEMALFREALLLGYVPQVDLFAYTPTVQPSVHHEWGTGAILYLVTIGTGWGAAGLTILKLSLIATLWLLLYRVARLRGADPILFCSLSWLVFPLLWVGFATVRAQLFTLVFIAAQLWMQEMDTRGGRRWIVGWLAMLILWLNLHAGFVVGLGMIAFHSLERVWSLYRRTRAVGAVLSGTWHLLLAAPLAVGCLLLNPYGPDYISYLSHALRLPRPGIYEWRPLWLTYAPGVTLLAFGASLLLIAASLHGCRWHRLRGCGFLWLSAWMALKHIRHGSIYAIVWIAYVPAWLSCTCWGRRWAATIRSHRAMTIRLCQVAVVGSLAFVLGHQAWLPTISPYLVHSNVCYPTAAVNYLRQQGFSGNIMTPFHAGAYVSWKMYPEVKVSLDGRYEVAYQPQVKPQHERFYEATDAQWWSILDDYATDLVLVPVQAPVYRELERLASDYQGAGRIATNQPWDVVYRDDSYAVLASPRWSEQLPRRDDRGVILPDGAADAWTLEQAHWRRSLTTVANRSR